MKYIIAFLFLLMAIPAWSGQITATWEYPHQVSDLQGIKLYHGTPESNATLVADITDPAARSWSGDVSGLVDGENVFRLTAYDSVQESEPAGASYNPPPPGADSFQVTVQVTVNVQTD